MLPSHAAPPAEVRLSRHGRFLNSQGCWSLVSRSVGVLGGEGCWGPPDPFLSHRGSLWALGLGRKHSSSAGPDPWPTGVHGAAAELETTSGGLQSNGGSGVPGTGCGHKQHCAYVGVCGGQASGPRSNCFKFQSRSDSQPCVPGQTVPGRWLPQRRARVPDARTQVGSQLKTRRGASGLSGPPPPRCGSLLPGALSCEPGLLCPPGDPRLRGLVRSRASPAPAPSRSAPPPEFRLPSLSTVWSLEDFCLLFCLFFLVVSDLRTFYSNLARKQVHFFHDVTFMSFPF